MRPFAKLLWTLVKY